VLSRDLARTNRSENGSRVFVRPGRDEHLIADLHTRLQRYPAKDVDRALRALVDAYHHHRGLFAVISGSFERAATTRLLLSSLTREEA
jgi:hypothetical protein